MYAIKYPWLPCDVQTSQCKIWSLHSSSDVNLSLSLHMNKSSNRSRACARKRCRLYSRCTFILEEWKAFLTSHHPTLHLCCVNLDGASNYTLIQREHRKLFKNGSKPSLPEDCVCLYRSPAQTLFGCGNRSHMTLFKKVPCIGWMCNSKVLSTNGHSGLFQGSPTPISVAEVRFLSHTKFFPQNKIFFI